MLDFNLIIILYGIITAIFLVVLFSILLSVFNRRVLSNLHIDTKLVVWTSGVTFVFLFFVVYYCFSQESFTISTYLIISAVFFVYVLINLIMFYVLLKPVREMEHITNKLADGKRNLSVELWGAKEFNKIEENLMGVIDNYKSDDKKLNLKDYEYQKYLPSSYLKFLSKTKIEDVKVGDTAKANVCIMFCDVRDSFFNSETMSLSDNFVVINKFLGIVSKEVRKFGGFVDKFMGDGVLSVFENEEDALNSAISIQQKIELENLNSNNVNKLEFGIAINSGSVMIGIVGDDKRKGATIIGDAVNLVNKVEHLNKMFKTKLLITKEILDKVNVSKFNYRYIGLISFDDLTESVAVFECFDGKFAVEKNALKKSAKVFESAVRNYEKEEYKLAKEQFIEVLKNANDDYLTRFYLAKCNSHLKK